MQQKEAGRFDQAVSALGKGIQSLLCTVGEHEKARVSEIRLRVGSPAVLSLPSGIKIMDTGTVTSELMKEAVLNLCGYSIYTHQHELAAGYISIPGGHRAGVCGRAAVCDGKITSVSDITSVCLRIAREHIGCADRIASVLFAEGVCSAVIAGAPGSGKTTLLRDISRILATGKMGQKINVAIVDERNEIALPDRHSGTSEICRWCDVLSGYPRAEGISQAVRSLSPDVVVCDEIGSEDDIRAIESGINTGVHIICTLHAGTPQEMADRPVTKRLLSTGAFDKFALLFGRDKPGSVQRVLNREEVYELSCRRSDPCLLSAYRAEPQRAIAQTMRDSGAYGSFPGFGSGMHKIQPSSAGQDPDKFFMSG